ncbi:hypothetical protein RM533_02910 [Croceicoccus sp. F390]|uniref:Uncharacterized protein n=1 Tax=Croceicoccus esteveae TaxID=3075597 RepID=A0ABU2ZGC5_9SPHN|nr:hypothetical protein [Croceicoccus sp. F390]MDT0575133.1 hypothetical protein [Croceicoccus sp. F390]
MELRGTIGGGQHGQDHRDEIESIGIDAPSKGDLLTVWIAYNLFVQTAGEEKDDFERWLTRTGLGVGGVKLLVNGAGEYLTCLAADCENLLQPRP